MSEVIVRMEMPTACPCDLIGVGYDLYCSGVGGIPARVKEYYECMENGTRPDWCPIKGELPDEHGDLIDRDVASEAFTNSFDEWDRDVPVFSANGVVGVLKSQKAVIAAERKDDENN